jgi:hypothetical protein
MMYLRDGVCTTIRTKSVTQALLIGTITIWLAHPVWSQAPGQQTFPSAQAAVDTLVSAVQKNDQQALSKTLGPNVADMIHSGNHAQDSSLVTEPDGTTTLYVGAENWPFPCPLVQKNGSWYFDSSAGKNEILYRTIGEGEITAIAVVQELADAEKGYYSQAHGNQPKDQYAQKIESDPGTQDGLHWESSDNSTKSPIGPDVASATTSGNSKPPQAFVGYYFRIARSQGPNAAGGEQNYINNGKMTHGFAIVAYPEKYGTTGIMTFIVDADGTVYQKDLGPNTDNLAKSMQFNPDSSWQKVDTERSEE